jgi:SHS2 domain-containing protein
MDVFAPNLPEMFNNAALGLYHILGIRKGTGDRESVHIELEDIDLEGLLVAFLNELLYQVEEGWVGEEFNIEIHETHLEAQLRMTPILDRQHDIKAVTYHELKIIQENGCCRTRIVFDL